MIKLIIADDHPMIVNGIKTMLDQEKDINLVYEAHNGVEVLDYLKENDADVVLMDINMPEVNGIDACKIIKEKYSSVNVLIFSQYDEKRFVKRVLKAGANGYLLKNSASTEIISAIKMIHKGGLFLSKDLPNIFEEGKSSRTDSLFPDLSSREIDVLKLICDEMVTQEIADKLFISKHTVETHRANLLLKVGVKNTAGLVKWAIENEIV